MSAERVTSWWMPANANILPPSEVSGFESNISNAPKVERSHNRPANIPSGYLLTQRLKTIGTSFSDKNEGVDTFEDALLREARQNVGGRFVILKQWEGYVDEVEGESFTARLKDIGSNGSEDRAEFALSEVPAFDKELVQSGAVFYWTIGYSDSEAGSRTRASTIRFRRLPVWDKSDLDTAKASASHILKVFG